MEPGHEDREYTVAVSAKGSWELPQWSPVMKTGNTGGDALHGERRECASMEPGHEDREYRPHARPVPARLPGLNGARS